MSAIVCPALSGSFLSEDASAFRSPDVELLSELKNHRPKRTSMGAEVDEMLSHHHHSRMKKDSWLGNSHDFAIWKDTVRKTLSDRLIVPDALGHSSQAILKKRMEYPNFTEERLEISVTSKLRTEAIVTIPKNGKRKHPALLLLHSLGSNVLYGKEKFLYFPGEPPHLTEYRQECYEGQSLLAEFARAGFLCISIDALGFGKRSLAAQQDFHAFDVARKCLNKRQAERISMKMAIDQWEQWARGFSTVGLSVASITATDDMRTVDYLSSRDDVDSERIACMGLSFGSFRANYLASLDERIKAAVSVCWISSHMGIVDYNIRYSMGHFAIPPNFYDRFDMIDIILSAAPKPYLGISGWKDILMDSCGIAEAHLAMREVWRIAGGEQNLGSMVYDAPHEFNIEMQKTARKFLAAFL